MAQKNAMTFFIVFSLKKSYFYHIGMKQ